MTDWSLLNGNPAPGSSTSLQLVEKRFAELATSAGQCRDDLVTAEAAVGSDRWEGSAAATFRAKIKELPDQLARVKLSYQEAADAVRDYRQTVEDLQRQAAALLGDAERRSADLTNAESKKRQAVDYHTGRVTTWSRAKSRRDAALRSANATPDPTTKAQYLALYQSEILATDRAKKEMDAAQAEVNRWETERGSAETDLSSYRDKAKSLAEALRAATTTLARRLSSAEKEAALPDWYQQAGQLTKEWLQEYGPVLVDALKTLGDALSLVALLTAWVPGWGQAIMIAALVVGSLAFLADVLVTATSDGGFTTAKLLKLGGDLLRLAATALGAGALAKGAKTFGTASFVLTGTSVSATAAGQFVEGDSRGGITTLVVGALCLGSGPLLKGLTQQAHKSPAVAGGLNKLSAQIRSHASTDKFLSLSPGQARNLQSMLIDPAKYGTGGKFLIGNQAGSPTLRSVADHSVSPGVVDGLRDGAAGALTFPLERAAEKVGDAFEDGEPELDVFAGGRP